MQRSKDKRDVKVSSAEAAYNLTLIHMLALTATENTIRFLLLSTDKVITK